MNFNYQLLTPSEQRIVKALAANGDGWLSSKQISKLALVSLPTARKKAIWDKLEAYNLISRLYFVAYPNPIYSCYGYRMHKDIVLINSQGVPYEIPHINNKRKSRVDTGAA